MITALSSGVEDAGELAELAKGSLRRKRPELRLALEGRVQEHQRFLFGLVLEHIEYLERLIHRVEVEIEAQLSQYEEAIQLLLTLPASGRISAAMILGKGVDMPRFPSAKHLASWAGCVRAIAKVPASASVERRRLAMPTSKRCCAIWRRSPPGNQGPMCTRFITGWPGGGQVAGALSGGP